MSLSFPLLCLNLQKTKMNIPRSWKNEVRVPNLKRLSANRGQNKKKKTVKTVQSGSRFTLFRLKYIKIISVSIWIL